MEPRQLNIPTDQAINAITELLSKFANPGNEILRKIELAPFVHGDSGVMVRKNYKGKQELIQFAFFLPNTQGKLARIVFNMDTFNKAPKFYAINMLKHLAEGMGEAGLHELETHAGRLLH